MKLTEKKLRERKVLSLAPLVVVPLLALVFHAMGGAKASTEDGAKPVARGVNMTLPDARFDPKKKGLNKLGLYGEAEADSLKLLAERRKDPYAKHTALDSAMEKGWLNARPRLDTSWRRSFGPGEAGLLLSHGRPQTDAQADELMGKLDKLKEVLRHQEERVPGPSMGEPVLPARPSYARPEPLPVTRGGGDPDLDKLNAMLDKVLRIQSPQTLGADSLPLPLRTSEHVVGVLSPVAVGRQGADTGQLLGVTNIPDPGGRKGDEEDGLGSGFMDIDGAAGGDSVTETTVRARVARDQTLVSGASVELRLDQDAVVGSRVIPRGSPVWGKVSLSGERAMVAVSSVRLGTDVVPLGMEVFDLDGMAGIRVEGSINRDAAKEATAEAAGTVGATTFDPSAAGQATEAGIAALRTLVGRKVRLVQFSLKAGYVVLLKNSKTINR